MTLLSRHFTTDYQERLDYLLREEFDAFDVGKIGRIWKPDEAPLSIFPYMFHFFGITPLYTDLYGERFLRNLYRDAWYYTSNRGLKGAINRFALATGTIWYDSPRYHAVNTTRVTGTTVFVTTIDDSSPTTGQIAYLKQAYQFLFPPTIEVIEVRVGDLYNVEAYSSVGMAFRVRI